MVKNTAYVVYGRMNPPTKGHQKLIEAARNMALKNKKSPLIVYTTYTYNGDPSHRKPRPKVENRDKNPLPPTTIMSALSAAFRKNKFLKSLSRDPYKRGKGPLNVRTTVATGSRAQPTRASMANKTHYPHRIFHGLAKQGYKRAVLVVGSDRVKDFTKALKGIKDNAGIDVKVVSGGTRDANSNNINGVTATMARYYALVGNKNKFRNVMPTNLPKNQINGLARTIVKKTSANTKKSIRDKHFKRTPGKGGSIPTPDILGSIRRNLTPRRTI